jgi:hypothetical protein
MRGIPGVNEKDWKLFRSRIPEWQEAYMDRLNHEYIEILSGEGNPSDKFWKLEERIRQDKKDSGVQAEMKRSNMKFILMNLLDEGAVTAADLEGFSEELKDALLSYIEIRKNYDC